MDCSLFRSFDPGCEFLGKLHNLLAILLLIKEAVVYCSKTGAVIA